MDQDRFDRSKRLGWFDLDKVRSAIVAVIGCGALGNEVVKDLILSGFRRFWLVDMDKVEGSNLNRCLFFTERDAVDGCLKVDAVRRGALGLDPSVDVRIHPGRIEDMDGGIFSGSDVVLGCLDNVAARIHVNSHAKAAGVPYIDGATNGLQGRVQVVTDKGPCLECNMNRSHMRVLNLRQSCTGEDITFFEPRLAGEITTTSLVAAVQVRETLKVIHGLDDRLMGGIFYYDGLRNSSEVLQATMNPSCPHHGEAARTLATVDDRSANDRPEEVEKVG